MRLQGYVFAFRSGPAWPEVEPWLRHLWGALAARVEPGAAGVPEQWPAGSEEVAHLGTAGAARVVLRVDDDAVTLALTVCGGSWEASEAWWDGLLAAPPRGLVGTATLLIGVADPFDGGSGETGPPGRLRSGTEVCELMVGDGATDEARRHRRLLVRPGDAPEVDELARYLFEAARLRYEMRVWRDGQDFRMEAAEAQLAVDKLRAVLTRPGGPDPVELSGGEEAVRAAQRRRTNLVETTLRLRLMQRFAAGSHARLVAALPVDTGPFHEDGALADYFAAVLDEDATFVEAVSAQAQEVDTLASIEVRRLLARQNEEQKARDEASARRRERVNLVQGALLGTLTLTLGALSTLDLKPSTWPPATKGSVVSVLASTGLLVAMTAISVALPSRNRRFRAGVVVAIGLLAGSVTWLVATTTTTLSGRLQALIAAGVVLVAAGLTVAARRRRRPDPS